MCNNAGRRRLVQAVPRRRLRRLRSRDGGEHLRRDGGDAARGAAHGGATAAASIINTTSIGGINAGAGVMAYRATKAAVIHLTRSIAVELARHEHPRELHRARAHPDRDQREPRPVVDRARDAAAAARGIAARRRGSRRSTSRATGPRRSPAIVLPVDGGTTAGSPPRSIKDLMAAPASRSEVSAKSTTDVYSCDDHLDLSAVPPKLWESRLPRALRRARAPRGRRATAKRCGCATTHVMGRSGHAAERARSRRASARSGAPASTTTATAPAIPKLRLAGPGPRRPARRR